MKTVKQVNAASAAKRIAIWPAGRMLGPGFTLTLWGLLIGLGGRSNWAPSRRQSGLAAHRKGLWAGWLLPGVWLCWQVHRQVPNDPLHRLGAVNGWHTPAGGAGSAGQHANFQRTSERAQITPALHKHKPLANPPAGFSTPTGALPAR